MASARKKKVMTMKKLSMNLWSGAVAASVFLLGGCALEVENTQAAEELARTVRAEQLRKALGKHADVLDLAVTDSTAEEIGIAAGYAPSTAKKCGARVIDSAIAEYLAIAA